MPVQQGCLVAGVKLEWQSSRLRLLRQPTVEQIRTLLDALCCVRGKEIRVLIDEGQQAARFASQDWPASLDIFGEAKNIPLRQALPLLHQPLRDEWSAAAPQ